MLNFIKKQGIGTWISLGVLPVAIIGLILYSVALSAGMDLEIASASQPFYEATRPEDMAMMSTVVACSVIAIVLIAAALVLGQFKFEGIVGKVCDGVLGALRIVAPALLIVAFLYFVYGSFTGLGWTFFSNEELEIAPEAVTVGHNVIAGVVLLVISAVAAVVASFFAITKKVEA